MPTDYSQWFTKQAAAEAIGVSTKTIEKLADNNKLQQRSWKRPGKPAIVVYHPKDVERVRKERNPDAEPFVLPPSDEGTEQSMALVPSQRMALVPATSENSQSPVEAVAAALAAIITTNAERVRIAERLFLTLDEAAEYSGLPKRYLRALMNEGKLGLRTGAGWRIRRADLENL